MPEDTLRYPSIPARLKAIQIDSVIILLCQACLLTLYSMIGYETPAIMLLLVGVVVYEPFCVSWRGQTVGQQYMGFRIIDTTTRQNLSLRKSCGRFLLKTCLGVLSLVWAFFTRRQQSLHDLLTRSMAVMTELPIAPPEDIAQLPDHQAGDEIQRSIQPSLMRRIICIVIYSIGMFVLYGILVG